MKKINTYLRLSFFVLSIAIAGCGSDPNKTFRTTEIKSDQIAEKLFIKTMTCGLTADNQITTISTTDSVDFNKRQSNEYYIINGLDPFFYRQSSDSLFLYTQTPITVPKNFQSKWKIIQIIEDSPTLMSFHHDKRYKRP